MMDTCWANKGVGLAANQIGVYKQIAFVCPPKAKHFFMVNPKILEAYGDEIEENEGCLSVPKKFGIVKRYQYVVIEFQELDGTHRKGVCCDYEARIVQHEIDHLNNVLCIDRMIK